jgi:hypothetical protein
VIAALAESEERYRTLVEGVRRYAIYTLSPDGTIQTWNRGIEELLGYTREEIVGSSGDRCFTPEDLARGAFQTDLADAARDGESNQDRSALHKDGHHFAVNDIVTALRTSSGVLIGFAKITRELYASGAEHPATADAAAEPEVQLARAMGLLHLEIEHRRRLEVSLLTAVEEERQRLGQDLHDGLCQYLGGLALMTAKHAQTLAGIPGPQLAAEEIAHLLRGAIDVTRNIAKGLHPVTLSSKGLPAALAELAERVPSNVIFDWPESERLDLDPAVALHVYRIAEEALGNALRHADPQNVVMRLTLPADGCIALLIEDDGCGFDVTRRSSGMGLSNMKYRASAIDGSLTVESRAGAGTRIRCDFPLREGRANAALCR